MVSASILCLKMAIFCLVLEIVNGLIFGNHTCGPAGYVCYPSEGSFKGLPLPTLYGNMRVYTAIMSANTAVKKVNEHEMVVTYEPWILLLWQDPRLRFRLVPEFQVMPDEMSRKIWMPEITVEDRISSGNGNRNEDLGWLLPSLDPL